MCYWPMVSAVADCKWGKLGWDGKQQEKLVGPVEMESQVLGVTVCR